MTTPTSTQTDTATQKKQSDKKPAINDTTQSTTSTPTTSGDSSPNTEAQKDPNTNMITIPLAEYQSLLASHNMLKEIAHRVDHMIMDQKKMMSISLNQTVLSHNILAGLEGSKDAIFLSGRQQANGNQKVFT